MDDQHTAQPKAAESRATTRRRWLLGVGLFIPATAGLALLVLLQLDPERNFVPVLPLRERLTANTRSPAMFADQLAAASDRDETSRQLTARLQREFPLGTTERTLKTALLAQGFTPIDAPENCVQPVQHGEPLRLDGRVAVCPPQDQRKSLKYQWGSGACGSTIWVRWSTDASEVITLLDGYYNTTCP